jgi:hypothetical protein
MKQALFLTENRIAALESGLRQLRREGLYPEVDEKGLFSTQAEVRTLFHTVDVGLVKDRTAEFTAKLDRIDKNVRTAFVELGSRRNFSVWLMLAFIGMGITLYLLSRTPGD